MKWFQLLFFAVTCVQREDYGVCELELQNCARRVAVELMCSSNREECSVNNCAYSNSCMEEKNTGSLSER